MHTIVMPDVSYVLIEYEYSVSELLLIFTSAVQGKSEITRENCVDMN